MMPVLDQNPAHHLHGHGHQTFYHQQHIPEHAGKMQLTLILPNGVPSVISVDTNTPMMDLLVQVASLNKLNPSGYSLVVLDSNQHIIHFNASQTVGQIVQNCQLPQINGSSAISLLPKDAIHPHPSSKSKSKTQPFEITVRLQVNLPDGQKILLRVDPTLPLHEIKEQICKQKKYKDSNRYTLRLPNKLEQPLLLGLSLAEYKTNILTLVHLNYDPKLHRNEMQSFDRLYRTRSESQPTREAVEELRNEQQEATDGKQRPVSVQLNPTRSSSQGQNVTSLPTRFTRPITSHTSLHAYWNDPNFDTQSQTSNSSSTTKKRRAPKPPGYISPTLNEQQIIQSQLSDHHQSQESLTESVNGTKQKRKAPTPPMATVAQETQTNETIDDQQTIINTESQKHDRINDVSIEQPSSNDFVEQKTSDHVEPIITVKTTNEDISETSSSMPIYSQIQKMKESVHTESPYSTVQVTSITSIPQEQQEEILHNNSSTNYSTIETVQPVKTEPRITSPTKPSKKHKSIDGLIKIVNDHNERADLYKKSEKEQENISYFRVAKSRDGKFETDSQGFIDSSNNVFDSIDNNKQQSVTTTTTTTEKSIPIIIQHQIKEKQETNLSKQQEQHEPSQISNITKFDREKSPTPIQLEVTERTTHISVTVESDRKQIITRTSPVPQQAPTSPSISAPRSLGKTITEYRTVRRIGNDGETTTTTTVRTETVPSTLNDQKQIENTENVDPTNLNVASQHESSTESTQHTDTADNLNKT